MQADKSKTYGYKVYESALCNSTGCVNGKEFATLPVFGVGLHTYILR